MEMPSGVLITGGRGFIGRAVGKLLRRHSYRVISVDLAPKEAESDEISCDIRDLSELRSLFQRERPDVLIHLAAILPTAAQRDPVLATKVNIQGSLNLLELTREFQVRRFLFGSSLSVYGTCPPDQVVSESNRAAPEDLYGAAKLYVEQVGGAYRRKHGLEFVSLRIGRVVGPGARSVTSAWRSEIFECLADHRPGIVGIPYADSERLLLVHVEDVAKMLLELLRSPRPRDTVYNAACESVIVGELRSEIERLNSRVQVRSNGQVVAGNPRQVDWSRFAGEFGSSKVPIFERLRQAAAALG